MKVPSLHDDVTSPDTVPFAVRMDKRRGSTPGIETLDAERCRAQGRWEELLEILLMQLDNAKTHPTERARLFVEIALVFRDGLADPSQALDGLIEAWSTDPSYEPTIAPLEELARAQERWPEVFAVTEKLVAAEKDPARSVVLCERMVWWLTCEMPTPALAGHYAERVRAVEMSHAVVHLHQASVFRAHGDWKREIEELDRAMLGAKRPEDKALAHLMMSLRYGDDERLANRGEAKRHYAAALSLDPRNMDALHGLEAIHERDGDLTALADVLEKHAEAANDDDERVTVLLRLADLYEKHFVKPDLAAAKLKDAFSLDPHNAGALAALERCYRATRQWHELVGALEVAALGDDPAMQRSSLASLAEVLESKLDDAASAVKAYERLRSMTPDDDGRSAPEPGPPLAEIVGHLARLTEKLGDWRAAAGYRAALAELAPEPSIRARMHLAAGQLLASADREPTVARVHFEEAVASDPGSEAAWNALLWDARNQGDHARVAGYLEQRAAASDSPRMKAQLYVEAAIARRAHLHDEAGALAAYEAANLADPTNESAAYALLELYVSGERWQDADKLCERVARAAERDGDNDRLYFALSQGRKIAVAYGEPARALAISVSCFDLKPDLPEARDALLESAVKVKNEGQALAPAKEALTVLADRGPLLSPAKRAVLGDLLVACGEPAPAFALFESALEAEPANALALGGLAGLYTAKKDFVAAGSLRRQLARTLESADAKFALLIECAETFASAAGNATLAIEAYEEARALRPKDHQLLHTLLGAYQSQENWPKVADILRAVADSDDDPTRRGRSVFAMAQIARDKLGDPKRAAALFDEALELDPTRLEAFERLVRLHTEAKDWNALEHAYRRMIARAVRGGDTKLQHALYHQLGLIYRDRLKNGELAIGAFRAATELRPDDHKGHTILRELLAMKGRPGDAAALAMNQVRNDPLNTEPYAQLFGLLVQERAFDSAFSVASVMNHLGVLGGATEFYRQRAPVSVANIPYRLAENFWRSHLVHAELDPTLTWIFELMAPALIDLSIAQMPLRERFGHPGPALPATGATSWVGSAFARVAEVLGLEAPRLFLLRAPTPAISPAPARPPGLFVSPEGLEAVPMALRPFVFGKRVFELAPPLLARAIYPTVTELTALLAAAARVAGPSDQRRTSADETLRTRFSRADLESLGDAVSRAMASGAKVEDVERWSRLADVSTSRAGLLIAGDVEIARGALAREPQSPGNFAMRDQLKELVSFVLSDGYLELRRALGIDVKG